MDGTLRPAFGRTKHVLPDASQPDAFPNDRHYYSVLSFLQKRRGGGGASSSSGGSPKSSTFGMFTRWRRWSRTKASKAHTSDSSSGSSSSKPTAPKSGSLTGGSSPSKPKSPVSAPPKAPKLPKIPKIPKIPKVPKVPKIPKPDSGQNQPKGSLPDIPLGRPPYRGSGGYVPVVTGGQSHDSHHASSATDCINPKGFTRLNCAKKDAVVGITFAILGLIGILFLVYLYIRRKGARKSRHEEDAMEMSRGAMDCDPGLQTEDAVSDGKSNIGLAVSTFDEDFTLTKERTQDSVGGNSSLVCQPQLSRLSSGMLFTAKLGLALQESTTDDVPRSLAGSMVTSEPMGCSSDIGEILCESRENGKLHGPGGEQSDSVDDDKVEDGDTWSSGRSSSRPSSDQPDGDTLDVTATRCSHAKSSSPPSGSETFVDSDDPYHL